MQRFINNWSAPLLAAAGQSADELHISPDLAEQLVGLDEGDHYLVTAALLEGRVETAWEVIRVTGRAGGVLSVEREQEGTDALDLPVGAVISARPTAGTLQGLQFANPMTTAGDLIIGGPGGAPQRLAPGSTGKVLKMAGGAPAWADEAGGGGGGFLTRANMVDMITAGALGRTEPELYAIPGIGAMIYSQTGALGVAGWLSDTPVSHTCTIGGVRFDIDNIGGDMGVVRGTGSMLTGAALSTVGSSSGVVSLTGGMPGVDPSEVVDGSHVEMSLRLGTLNGGANLYNIEATLYLAPVSVRFQYGEDYGGVWEVYWMDDEGADQAFATSVSASISITHVLRVEKSGGNLLVKMNSATVLTLPLAEMWQGDNTFGCSTYVGRFGGSDELLFQFNALKGQLTLAS
ncbi:hypothetical protein D9M68_254110 [compost metagenome]